MAVALDGTVVCFDTAGRVLDAGTVWIDGDTIAAVTGPGEPVPAGFADVTHVKVGGVIYPGLIDLHSHMAYNTLPLWEAPGVPYAHHDSWTREHHQPDYSGTVSWPAKVLGQAAPEALIKYVEVKALIGGTTALQGAPHTTRPVNGWLVRIIDAERFGGTDRIDCSALQKAVPDLVTEAAKLKDQGHVLIYHVAEGQIGTVVHQEFTDLQTAGCVRPGLLGVHATSLADGDFAAWQAAVTAADPTDRGTVVWSPFSNLWLYNTTTAVAEAHAAGLRIALGSDWSPSGTKHVLGELKVADLLNHKRNLGFSDQDLCAMVTANGGDALARAWGGTPHIGRLQAGAAADLVVLEHHQADVHRNLIEATERHVRLVVVRGQPYYGTVALLKATGAQPSSPITVAGLRRRVVVQQPGKSDAAMDWKAVLADLARVRKDPVGAWRDSQHALASWGGALEEPDAPLAIFGDMPEGDSDLLAGGGEIPADIQIPAPDGLTHDAAFLAAVNRRDAPDLPGLADYYP